MFPFSVSGTIAIEGENLLNERQLAIEFGERIASYKPSAVSVAEKSIAFVGGPVRPVLSTNLLVSISRGIVEVSGDGRKLVIVYKLWFNEILLGGSLLAFFMAYASESSADARALVFGGFWFLFVGGNYALGAVRFRAMLRSVTLESANRARARGSDASSVASES